MDVIILAGGRGRRLGLLTTSQQKATLCFDGNPLVTHIVNEMLQEEDISKIIILTGYRGDDVHKVLRLNYDQYIQSGKIAILDFPTVQGTLSRLCSGLSALPPKDGCCVCGVDSLVPQGVLHEFLLFIHARSDDTALLLSPRIEVAPTHTLGCVQDARLIGYKPATTIERGNVITQDFRWCTDIGIRYFPQRHLQHLIHNKRANNLFIPLFIQELLKSGTTVRGFLFEENWKHFAVVEDFYGSFATS